MIAKLVLTLCLSLTGAGFFLTGCAGKVSGRFDMQQRFATGVEIHDGKPDKRK